MTELERSLDRRPALALVFDPRAARSRKLWRRVFLYYERHAERVWRRPDLRFVVRHELALAKAILMEALSSFPPADLAAYEQDPVIDRIEIEARFPETVDYVELFRMADRVFAASRRIAFASDAHAVRLRVSRALRRPAQVIAETPAILKSAGSG
jgi:hypothetical protein